jgi:hypothetical protein
MLERASLIDSGTADDLTLQELRAAAVEAGMSSNAVDAAISEVLERGREARHSAVTLGEPGSFIGSLAYASFGALLGALSVAGNGTWAEVVLAGGAVATLQLLARHAGSGGLGPLLKEATILWVAYSVAWMVGGGAPWPHLLALPPLALAVTTIGGFLSTRGDGIRSDTPDGQPGVGPHLRDGPTE